MRHDPAENKREEKSLEPGRRREKISENTGVKQIDDVNMIRREAHLENPAEKVNQSR